MRLEWELSGTRVGLEWNSSGTRVYTTYTGTISGPKNSAEMTRKIEMQETGTEALRGPVKGMTHATMESNGLSTEERRADTSRGGDYDT